MEKLRSYEQYSQVLSSFKQGRARCKTNKMMMREELTALIEAGKLYVEQTGNTLWFFSDEDYYYSAQVYAPADSPVCMERQDKDVVVELMGNESRYDEQMDRELVAAGFEKNGKYLEYSAQLDEIIEDVRRQNKVMHTFWERRGFTYRTATKADYLELRALWLKALGMDSYIVKAMTDEELKDMEKHFRCTVICDDEKKIVAACNYIRPNGAACAHMYYTAGFRKGSGLGASAYFDALISVYQEGCSKLTSWVRENNEESHNMTQRAEKLSGKFFWQFVCKRTQAKHMN